MDSDLCRLMDNRWEVLMFRDVAGQYTAAAKRPYRETWKDIFETVNQQGLPVGFPEDDFERQNFKGSRCEDRIGKGATPTEAVGDLAQKVFGLTPTPIN